MSIHCWHTSVYNRTTVSIKEITARNTNTFFCLTQLCFMIILDGIHHKLISLSNYKSTVIH
jgi:hypothetical protein